MELHPDGVRVSLPQITRRVRDRWRERRAHLLHAVLESCQRAGISLTPSHFYSQVPDLRSLKASTRWRRPFSMGAITGSDGRSQLEIATQWCEPRITQALAERDIHEEACAVNGQPGYGPVESEFLYCFIRSVRPRRVVQIGAGVSTAVILAAAADEGMAIDVACVDPFPTQYLVDAARRREVRLIPEMAQSVSPDLFASLERGDLLFIDSTHAVRPGSEVNRIILEILPGLAAGCFAHFHDITFPYDYSPVVLTDDIFFWSETVVLQAFLTGHSSWSLLVSLSMLHHHDPTALKRLLPGYRPAPMHDGLLVDRDSPNRHFPSSVYLLAGQPPAPNQASPAEGRW